MKKVICAMALSVMIVVSFTQTTQAQDNWVQGKTGIYSVGIGGTQVIAVGNNGFYNNGLYSVPRTSNIGLSLNVSGEYKVWNWVGVGFETGLDFLWYHYSVAGFSYSGGSASIGIPIGIKANAHILDAVGGLAIADKLDVYAGLNLGGGPLIPTVAHESVGGFIHVGPQFGARYWFSKQIAVFAEFGWGATFANAGITF